MYGNCKLFLEESRAYTETLYFSRSGKSRKMVHDQYQAMGLVIPQKTYTHRPNV